MIILTIAKIIALLTASLNWLGAGIGGLMPLLLMIMPMLKGVIGGAGGLLGGILGT